MIQFCYGVDDDDDDGDDYDDDDDVNHTAMICWL